MPSQFNCDCPQVGWQESVWRRILGQAFKRHDCQTPLPIQPWGLNDYGCRRSEIGILVTGPYLWGRLGVGVAMRSIFIYDR